MTKPIPLSQAADAITTTLEETKRANVYMELYRAFQAGKIEGRQRRHGAMILLDSQSLARWMKRTYFGDGRDLDG